MLRQLTVAKKVILLFLLVSVFSFSKDFWEKRNFTVNVTEDATINGRKRSKSYVMAYNSGTMKLTITAPSVNKGEVYTFSGSKKTIYYPKLKQTGLINFTDEMKHHLPGWKKLFMPFFYIFNNRLGIDTYEK